MVTDDALNNHENQVRIGNLLKIENNKNEHIVRLNVNLIYYFYWDALHQTVFGCTSQILTNKFTSCLKFPEQKPRKRRKVVAIDVLV